MTDFVIVLHTTINGLAERMNRTLMNKTRALLKGSWMAYGYWGEAMLHAVNLYNRTATKALKYITPFESLLGRKPDNSYLRVFGCQAYVHMYREQGRGKLGDRGKHGVLLSHSDRMYWVYLTDTKKVVRTKHVVVNENIFPMKKDSRIDDDYESESFLELHLEEENSADVTSSTHERGEIEEEQFAPVEEEPQPRYLTRNRNPPERFVAGAMRRTFSEDESSVRIALEVDDALKWKRAMVAEVKVVKDIDFWTIVDRPKNTNIQIRTEEEAEW